MILLAAAALSALNPLTFFSGPTHGTGTIKIVFKATQPLRVSSHGRPDGHGGMLLDQKVAQGGEPPKMRHWDLRPTSSTTVRGTLSPDATGPVTGTLSGRVLSLAYPMKGGMTAAQTLVLQSGDRVLINHMTVKKFGITVATIDERITKD